jgi:hypothetical protein
MVHNHRRTWLVYSAKACPNRPLKNRFLRRNLESIHVEHESGQHDSASPCAKITPQAVLFAIPAGRESGGENFMATSNLSLA